MMRKGVSQLFSWGLRSDTSCSARIRLSVKIHDEYRDFKELPPALLSQQGPVGPSRPRDTRKMITAGRTFAYVRATASH